MLLFTSLFVCFVHYVAAMKSLHYFDQPTFSEEPENPEILGKTIYTPKTDLLASVPNGITFFDDLPSNCIRHAEEPVTTKLQTEYENTNSLYQKIGTDSNLDAKYQSDFSLHVTLDVTTNHVSESKRTVKGTSLDMIARSFVIQLSPNCLYEATLNSYLLGDFRELKLHMSEPWHESSWTDYRRFFERHGSHFITAVHYGSSISQYAFADSASSYTSNDFRIKACGSLSAEASSNSIEACSSVTAEEIEEVSSKKITSSITIRGGTAATRSQLSLQSSRTDELIQEFLNEAASSPGIIGFELTPIWEVLNGHHEAGDNRYIQAANLRYFYDGYLNFGCPYDEGIRGPALQKFDYASDSTSSNPVFECTIAPLGCHDPNDCHYKIGVKCSCRGDSCIKYTSSSSNTGASRKRAEANYGDGYGWGNCDWTTWGSVCGCKRESYHRQRIFP